MKRTTKWVIGSITVLMFAGAAGLAAIVYFVVLPQLEEDRLRKQNVAKAYDPRCAADDKVCATWTEFRRDHPYPYQSFAAKTLPDSSLVLVVSEPSPALSSAELDALTAAALGPSFVSAPRRLRWHIGVDGWLEDLVLHLRRPAGGGTPLDDPDLRDRIALLHEGLFGTNFGGDVEPIGGDRPAAVAGLAPNLNVSPAEIRAWMDDPSRTWTPADTADIGADAEPRTWPQLRAAGVAGTFTSDNHRLVMLTFPTSYVLSAQARAIHKPRETVTTQAGLDALRLAFREFAVASDGVFGGVWQRDGRVAILGRGRTHETNVLPPLRFETFALLASESGDELSQSYERNTVFAGRLLTGEHAGKDWAPIYLSDQLVDTELGALLNITDQMLKSWSESGDIEYLFFAHRKPDRFPFKEALSDVVTKRTKSTSTLFNWNTSGAAVVIAGDDYNVISATRTGALPVTYGADGKPHNQGGADLMDLEDEAFEYFATLKNPNLSRVAQYTLLYQMFRAIARESNGWNERTGHDAEVRPQNNRAGGLAELRRRTAALLDDLTAGRIDASNLDEEADAFRSHLQAVRGEFSQLSNVQLGGLLAARFSPESQKRNLARARARENKFQALLADAGSLSRDIDNYNALVRYANQADAPERQRLGAELESTRATLDQREQSLIAQKARFEAESGGDDPVDKVRAGLHDLAQLTQDLNAVMSAFVKANKSATSSSIRTPSVVVSWNRATSQAIGGHNVDASAVRFVRSSSVDDFEVSRNGGEVVVRYNPKVAPAIESRATRLARDIEHRKQFEVANLRKGLDPAPIRNVQAALESAEPLLNRESESFGKFGSHPRAAAPPADLARIRAIAEVEPCCIFIGRGADNQRVAFEQNLKPPPMVLQRVIHDTPSLVSFVGRNGRRGNPPAKPVILVNESEAHVKALALSFEGEALSSRLRSLADTLPPPGGGGGNSRRVAAVEQVDLRNRKGMLQTLTDAIGLGPDGPIRRLTNLTRPQPRAVWSRLEVSTLDAGEVQGLLQRARWNIDTDGMPVMRRLSFGNDADGAPLRATVVAGFVAGRQSEGQERLIRAATTASALARERDDASLAQVLMTVKNDLRQYPDAILRRLQTFDEESGIIFGWLRTADGHDIAN
jgi:hypothetical protein